MRIGSCALAASICAAFVSGCAEPTPTLVPGPPLYLNEIMPENDSTLADPQGIGGYPDWIEIFNAGSSDIDLGGMYLSDDPDRPTAYRIPLGVVAPAHGYVLFWADNDPAQGPTHTNFKLDAAGESVSLAGTSAQQYRTIDQVTYPMLAGDASYARAPDGGGTWRITEAPSPGKQNE